MTGAGTWSAAVPPFDVLRKEPFEKWMRQLLDVDKLRIPAKRLLNSSIGKEIFRTPRFQQQKETLSLP